MKRPNIHKSLLFLLGLSVSASASAQPGTANPHRPYHPIEFVQIVHDGLPYLSLPVSEEPSAPLEEQWGPITGCFASRHQAYWSTNNVVHTDNSQYMIVNPAYPRCWEEFHWGPWNEVKLQPSGNEWQHIKPAIYDDLESEKNYRYLSVLDRLIFIKNKRDNPLASDPEFTKSMPAEEGFWSNVKVNYSGPSPEELERFGADPTRANRYLKLRQGFTDSTLLDFLNSDNRTRHWIRVSGYDPWND